MVNILLAIYLAAFTFLSWKNFRLAVGFFIISFPAYLIRFDISPLPTTLLEISFGALFLVWLIKYARTDWRVIVAEAKKRKWFTIFFTIFFLSSLVSIFVSDMWYASLGQWRAYFLEPMLVFVMLVGRLTTPYAPPSKGGDRIVTGDLIWFLALSMISVSVVAIIQKLTGTLFPPSLWDDELNGRVTSFFTTPNAVGLFLAPIVMLVPSVIARSEATKQSHGQATNVSFVSRAMGLLRRPATAGLLAMTALSLLAIFFSFSQGAWIALGAGIMVTVYFLGYKKTAIAVVIVGIIVALAVPQIRAAALFEDKSGQNRLTLWRHSITYLTSSPQNFAFGAGIRQYFRKVEKPYYNPVEMERLIYPHNIFLNFWTEIGLLGMVSFVGMLIYLVSISYHLMKSHRLLGASLLAALVVMVVHGLVDVPYFKNDLAVIFWVIASLFFAAEQEHGEISKSK